MPYKANDARRHKIPRARYKVTSWLKYDRALQQRGSATVWVTSEALAAWHSPHTGQRGRPRDYSDVAIETGHLLRLAFGRPWRPTEGLLRSLTILLGVDVGVPDHTTFSRRSPGLALAATLAQAQASGPVHVVINATGLKVYGADAGTTPSQRDQHIQMIQAKGRLGVAAQGSARVSAWNGSGGWQKAVGYGRRSHAETTMFRYKAIIGSSLRARTLPAQKTKIGCSVLDRMTKLSMPVSQRIC